MQWLQDPNQRNVDTLNNVKTFQVQKEGVCES